MIPQQPPAYPRIVRAGSHAVTIEFSNEINESSSNCVLALDAAIQAELISGMLETIPPITP